MAHELDARQRLEEREGLLSPFAARSYQWRGRERPEEPSPLRTEFQRDREGAMNTAKFYWPNDEDRQALRSLYGLD